MYTDLCLQYLEYLPIESNQTTPSPIVIFLHGREANELDLFDLAPDLASKFRVLSVRAPIEMGKNAFAWFHKKNVASEPNYDPKEVENSLDLLAHFISEVQAKYQVPANQVFLFGFSQGAMMSFGIALRYPGLISGIVALGGRVLPELLPKHDSSKLKDFPILLSHGIYDEVISINYAREVRKVLLELQVQLSYFEYPMGHDVTEPEL